MGFLIEIGLLGEISKGGRKSKMLAQLTSGLNLIARGTLESNLHFTICLALRTGGLSSLSPDQRFSAYVSFSLPYESR